MSTDVASSPGLDLGLGRPGDEARQMYMHMSRIFDIGPVMVNSTVYTVA